MATLGHEQQIMTGISKVEIAPVGVITESTVWTELFYTLRDSVKLTQPVPTRTDIEVDQQDAPLKSIYKAGVTTLEFDIPDVSLAILEEFYATTTPSYVPAGFDAVGLSLSATVKERMIKVTSGDGEQVIIFTNGTLTPNLDMSTPQTKATAVHISCTALAPSVLGETEPVIIYNKVTTPVTLYTWKKFGTSSVGAGLTDTYTDGVTTHIGLAFNKTTAVESTNAADYIWTPIAG